jgi:hypothetical protein
MKLPRELHDDNRAFIMLESRSVAQTIREMEAWAKKFDISLSNDKLYIALRAYKKALTDLIER